MDYSGLIRFLFRILTIDILVAVVVARIDDCPSTLYTLAIHKEEYRCYNNSVNGVFGDGAFDPRCIPTKISFSAPRTAPPYNNCGYREFSDLGRVYLHTNKTRKYSETGKIIEEYAKMFHSNFTKTLNNFQRMNIANYYRKLNTIPRSHSQIDGRLKHLIKHSGFIFKMCIESQKFHRFSNSETKAVRYFLYNLQTIYFNTIDLQKLTYIESIMKKVMPSQKEIVLNHGLKLYNIDVNKLAHYCYTFSADRCQEILTDVDLVRLENGYEIKKFNENKPIPEFYVDFYHHKDIKNSELCDDPIKCTGNLLIQEFKISKKCFTGTQYINGNTTTNDIDLDEFENLLDQSVPERTRQCLFMCYVKENCARKQAQCAMESTNKVYDLVANMHNDIVSEEQMEKENSGWQRFKTCKKQEINVDMENNEEQLLIENNLTPDKIKSENSKPQHQHSIRFDFTPTSTQSPLFPTTTSSSSSSTTKPTHPPNLNSSCSSSQMELQLLNARHNQAIKKPNQNKSCTFIHHINGDQSWTYNDCNEIYVNFNYDYNNSRHIIDPLGDYCRKKRTQYCGSPINIQNLETPKYVDYPIDLQQHHQNDENYLHNLPSSTKIQTETEYSDYEDSEELEGSGFELMENDLDQSLSDTVIDALKIKIEDKLIQKMTKEDKIKIIQHNVTLVPINKFDLSNFNPFVNIEIVKLNESQRCNIDWVPIEKLDSPVRICPGHYTTHPSYLFVPMHPGNRPRNFQMCRYGVNHLLTRNFIRIGIHESENFFHVLDRVSIINMLEFTLVTLSNIIDINFELVDATSAKEKNLELNLIVAFNHFQDNTINGYFHTSGVMLIDPIGLNKQQIHRLFMHEFLHMLGFEDFDESPSILASSGLNQLVLIYPLDIINLILYYPSKLRKTEPVNLSNFRVETNIFTKRNKRSSKNTFAIDQQRVDPLQKVSEIIGKYKKIRFPSQKIYSPIKKIF